MHRPTEELLEFDRLKEIVGGFTTCAPGRRVTEGLETRQDRAGLEAEFALIRETIDYLRSGSELGFSSLADTEPWLAKLAIPASVLSSAEFLDAASLIEAVFVVRQTFKGEGTKYRCLAEHFGVLPDLRSQLAAIRRAVMPNGEISDEASTSRDDASSAAAAAFARLAGRFISSNLRYRGNIK